MARYRLFRASSSSGIVRLVPSFRKKLIKQWRAQCFDDEKDRKHGCFFYDILSLSLSLCSTTKKNSKKKGRRTSPSAWTTEKVKERMAKEGKQKRGRKDTSSACVLWLNRYRWRDPASSTATRITPWNLGTRLFSHLRRGGPALPTIFTGEIRRDRYCIRCYGERVSLLRW